MNYVDPNLLEELRRACNARPGSLHPSYAQGLLRRCLEVMERDKGSGAEEETLQSASATYVP